MVRNARFWIWENGDWVKLTMRPGQTITRYWRMPCDEGWASAYSQYQFNGSHVLVECESDGCDCDGRLTDSRLFVCPLANLKAIEADEDRPARPEWEKVRARQFDEYAEMAGY